MASILIVHASTDGHTVKICQYLRDIIGSSRHRVCLRELNEPVMPDLADFDTIVVGASIRYGHHARKVYQFIRINTHILNKRKNAFFSVNLVARKAGKNQPHNNPYMKLFLARIHWRPQHLAVFAGKLNYPLYGFWDRQIIRLIMRLSGGPTDPATVVDYTDWRQVEAFGQMIGTL